MQVSRFKLYHFPASRSVRVKWLLHELLDDDFDVETVALYEGEQYSDAFARRNPNRNVPVLEITLASGETKVLLESGAMIAFLADAYPQRQLAPAAGELSWERADYLQMLHFGTSWIDMMLWQIRIHTHLLGDDADPRTIQRYREKFTGEVEPQLIARLERHEHICGDAFSAVDCVMGQNVLWARAYGLCQPQPFSRYLSALATRPAFAQAYADMDGFTLEPPADSPVIAEVDPE